MSTRQRWDGPIRVALCTLVVVAGIAASAARWSTAGASIRNGLCSLRTESSYEVGPCLTGLKADKIQRKLFVSPSGNDRNPGTKSKPMRTLRHVQSVVRMLNGHMTGSIAIYLENGVYRLTRPLQLNRKDSGTNGHSIIWSAAAGAHPIISGGLRVTGWKQTTKAKNIWSAPVPAYLRTRQLYVNGNRAELAFGSAPVSLKRIWSGYIASSSIMSRWRNPTNIDFVYSNQLGDNVEPRCPVGTIAGRVITMAQPCWNNSNNRQHNLVGFSILTNPTYIENAYELLDQGGEFYLDSSAHRLYYIPRKGQNMRTANVMAPELQTLVSGRGKPGHPIHNIVFSGLQFSYATWMQPSTPTGFSEVQANYTITGADGYATQGLCKLARHGTCPYGAWTKEPGNVQFAYDRNISLLNDRFVHLGAAGLDLDNGSQNSRVEDSVFTDISGNGVEIGGVNLPEAAPSSQTLNVRVVDNHLYGLPVEYHGGVALLLGYAANTTISHNQIDHTPYIAISTGWGGWLDKILLPSVANYSHDNAISNNLIYDYMQTLSDGGGVYTQGITGTSMANGQKVTGNVIHGQLDWGSALKADDGGAYITYSGNVLYDNTYDWGGVHYDYRKHPGALHPKYYDAELITNNFWQQGDPDFSRNRLTRLGNTTIQGPQDAPGSIIVGAGVGRHFEAVLASRPGGEVAPRPPDHVTTLYRIGGRAYVTWHPSSAEGSSSVTSYTVRACQFHGSALEGWCHENGRKTLTVSAAAFDRLGYAVMLGLMPGRKYQFSVAANSGAGSSTPSVPSAPTPVGSKMPGLLAPPTNVRVRLANNAATVIWYRPKNNRRVRNLIRSQTPKQSGSDDSLIVLSNVVTASSGTSYTVTGHQQLISLNDGGRAMQVFSGLRKGHKYRFTISAMDPSGLGPPSTTGWVKVK